MSVHTTFKGFLSVLLKGIRSHRNDRNNASSIGCRARDEGFVLEAIVSSTIQKTGFPERTASE